MQKLLSLLRKRAKASFLSAAGVLVMVQLVLPSLFDFIFDLIVLALMYGAMKLEEDKR